MMKVALPYGQSVTVSSLAEASGVVREYTRDIGYHDFYTSAEVGLVTDDGQPVARVSYNGLVWDPADNKHQILV